MAKKKTLRNKFLIEGLISVIIVISPLLHYAWKYIPNGIQEIYFFSIKIDANGFEDINTSIYYYLMKFVPLMLLMIWFITCKEWWYHAIILPITMYAFQLLSAITIESNIVDENEILYIVAVNMVITPIIYFIRLKLVDKYVHGIDLKAMDQELKFLKEKEALKKEWEKLEQQKAALLKKM